MRRRTSSQRRLPRLAGDDGAVMVEFALAAPLLAVLMLGTLEFGMAWRETNFIERSVQGAGRVASNLGDDMTADAAALRSLDASLDTLKRASVDRVVIFESTTADGKVPDNCKNADTSGTAPFGVSGSCNVYTAAQAESATFSGLTMAQVEARTDCAGDWDGNWCPNVRSSLINNPDHIGVWVRIDYERFTGLISGSFTIERTAVYQLEPEFELP